MKKVAVILANGFEEIEAITIIDVLRRAGTELDTIALEGEGAKGSHGVEVKADLAWDDAISREWDMIVLPGGQPGSDTLRDSTPLKEFLNKHSGNDKEIAAICAAPIALAAAGLLEGKDATCYPGFEDQLIGANLKTERVVKDGRLTTSRGPGTALEFSLRLVETLVGKEKASELAHGMLVQ